MTIVVYEMTQQRSMFVIVCCRWRFFSRCEHQFWYFVAVFGTRNLNNSRQASYFTLLSTVYCCLHYNVCVPKTVTALIDPFCCYGCMHCEIAWRDCCFKKAVAATFKHGAHRLHIILHTIQTRAFFSVEFESVVGFTTTGLECRGTGT